MAEVKEIPGFNGRYLVTSSGDIITMIDRNGRRGTLLKGFINNMGYRVVRLSRYEKAPKESFLVHRLVAMAFLSEPPRGKTEVDHIDGNPLNCRVGNLQWVSGVENRVLAAKRSGRKYESHPIVMFSPKGERFEFEYAARAESFFKWPHGLVAGYLRDGMEFVRGYYVKYADENPTFPTIQDLLKKGKYRIALERYPDRGRFELFFPWADKDALKDAALGVRRCLYSKNIPHVSVLTCFSTKSLVVTLSD